MVKLYYTPKEVAEILDISDDTVLDLVNRRELPALRVSARVTRIPIAAFDLWRKGFKPRRRKTSIGTARRKVVVGEGEQLPVPRRLTRA